MQTTAAQAAPARHRFVEEPRMDYVTTGAVFIGLSVVSLGIGVMSLGGSSRDSHLQDGNLQSSDRPGVPTYAFTIAAITGAIGTGLLTFGLVRRRKTAVPINDAQVSVGPSGLAFSGSF